jgi:hypothetical protein
MGNGDPPKIYSDHILERKMAGVVGSPPQRSNQVKTLKSNNIFRSHFKVLRYAVAQATRSQLHRGTSSSVIEITPVLAQNLTKLGPNQSRHALYWTAVCVSTAKTAALLAHRM